MQSSLIKHIGWIGTGVMGKSMCEHLLRNGFQLSVYNRTRTKTEELVQKGALYRSPKEMAAACDAIFLMVGYPRDVEAMFGEVVEHMRPGSVLVDHTTSSPTLAQRIFTECKKRGIDSIDAPVTGGDIGAKNGKLTIMCGGEQTAFDRITPALQSYGANIKLMGKEGQGQHAKMVNQIAIANTILGVVESLLYAYKAGLDLNLVLETIGSGAAGSFQLNVSGGRMLRRDFDPGFYVEHFVKDMEIALEEASRVNLSLPGLALVKQFYQALMAQGGARLGTQAILLVLERMNNVDLSKPLQKD